MSFPLYDLSLPSGLLAGLLFGYALEAAGFGSPRKLTAQFSLRDFAVFKVMFTAVLVAAIGLYLLRLGGVIGVQSVYIPTLYFWAILAGGLRHVGYDLIFAGQWSTDWATGGTGPGVAHMLRLRILPTGWIYPKEKRAIRDLLRRRSQLVRQRTASRLGLRNVLERTTGRRLSANALKRITADDLAEWIDDANIRLSMSASLAIIDAASDQIVAIEARISEQAVLEDGYRLLTTIPGVGPVIASTIQYETGDIGRFESVTGQRNGTEDVVDHSQDVQHIDGPVDTAHPVGISSHHQECSRGQGGPQGKGEADPIINPPSGQVHFLGSSV